MTVIFLHVTKQIFIYIYLHKKNQETNTIFCLKIRQIQKANMKNFHMFSKPQRTRRKEALRQYIRVKFSTEPFPGKRKNP